MDAIFTCGRLAGCRPRWWPSGPFGLHDEGRPVARIDPAASAVLEAFEAAQEARLPPVVCYRAGIEAWRRAHPDQMPKYAALQAVDVILAAKVRLRVDDA